MLDFVFPLMRIAGYLFFFIVGMLLFFPLGAAAWKRMKEDTGKMQAKIDSDRLKRKRAE